MDPAWRLFSIDFGGRSCVTRLNGAEIHARFQANIHQPCSLGHVARAPGLKEFGSPTKRSRAKTQDGHLQASASQRSEFHEK